MRVWTKIVINMSTGEVIGGTWDEYSGPVAECKGGGGMEVDKDYNARMAAISEGNQAMAEEMFNLFKYGVTYDPTEKVGRGQYETEEYKAYQQRLNMNKQQFQKDLKAYEDSGRVGNRPTMKALGPAPEQYGFEETRTRGDIEGYNPDDYFSEMDLMQEMLKAQGELLPYQTRLERLRIGEESRLLPAQTDLALEQIGATFELLPYQTDLAKTQMSTTKRLTTERGGVMSAMYKDALKGVDVGKRVSETRAGVHHGFKSSMGIRNRQLSRMGIDPSSGRGISVADQEAMSLARGLSGAEAGVRTAAEQENFERKRVAAGLPI